MKGQYNSGYEGDSYSSNTPTDISRPVVPDMHDYQDNSSASQNGYQSGYRNGYMNGYKNGHQAPAYRQPPQQPVVQQPVVQPQPVYIAPQHPAITEEYRPLSPWGYFGYTLLFAIPIAGLIVNIVLCFAATNKNVRNFARSLWCGVIIALIIVAVLSLMGVGVLAFLESILYSF